jgi:hypothetical protein
MAALEDLWRFLPGHWSSLQDLTPFNALNSAEIYDEATNT